MNWTSGRSGPSTTWATATSGSNQSYYTFALIILIKIVLCSKFHCTKLIDFQCFHVKRAGACELDLAAFGPEYYVGNFSSSSSSLLLASLELSDTKKSISLEYVPCSEPIHNSAK